MRRSPPSGRFLLRLTPGLHAALRRCAREAGLSLNDYCARKLATSNGFLDEAGGAAAIVNRAAELFAQELVGVFLFGSWARAEAVTTSDVDVLIIVEPGAPIRRDLYRRWDERPLKWDVREVEPHFVRLSSAGTAAATGL